MSRYELVFAVAFNPVKSSRSSHSNSRSSQTFNSGVLDKDSEVLDSEADIVKRQKGNWFKGVGECSFGQEYFGFFLDVSCCSIRQ